MKPCRALLVSLCVLAAGCPRTTTVAVVDAGQEPIPDAGCPALAQCGELGCCTEGEVCFEGQCCRPRCDAECGPDGCGGTCADCPVGERCDLATRTCTDECGTDEELCGRAFPAGACGSKQVEDECRVTRTLTCGCPQGQACRDGQCVCAAETDAAFCARLGIQCGRASGLDNCESPREVEDCGDCSLHGQVCDTERGTCVACFDPVAAFCARHGRNCGPFQGVNDCGETVSVDCGSCSRGKQCRAEGLCAMPGGPLNDDCASPEELAFDEEGRAHTWGWTWNGLEDSRSVECGGTGPDVVYQFELTAESSVVFQLHTTHLDGTDRTPVLSIRPGCEAPETELVCASLTATVVEIRKDSLPAGTYFLWVNEKGGQDIQFELFGQVHPHDSCARAQNLIDGQEVRWDLRFAADRRRASCASEGGGEVFYSFALPTRSSARASLRSLSSSFWPALSLVPACDETAPEIDCSDAPAPEVGYGALEAGTYYLVVDGLALEGGRFELKLTSGPPIENDTCAKAEALVLDGSLNARTASDTWFARDDVDVVGHWAPPTGKDLVYYFEVPPGGRQDVQITVTPALSGSKLVPTIGVWADCQDPESEIASAGNVGMVGLRVSRLDPGVYYLWVDGSHPGADGPFSLTLEMIAAPPRPANDACAGAVDLVFDSLTGRAEESGTTVGASDDATGLCADLIGSDVVYRFALARPSRIVAKAAAQPWSQNFRPALHLRRDCERGGRDDELACEPGVNSVAVLRANVVPEGVWYLIVDSEGEAEGDFQLTLEAYPNPTNLSCETAEVLALVPSYEPGGMQASVLLDTTLAANTTTSSCSGDVSGNDVVYRFEVPPGPRQDVTVTATPVDSDATPVVSVRAICDSPASEIGCADTEFLTGKAELKLRQLPPGTYYVLVDAHSGWSNGASSLTVVMTESGNGPPHDDCGGAQVLTLDEASGTASATGTTEGAGPDAWGSCGGGAATGGPDVVYKVELPAERDLKITVTPDMPPPDSNERPLLPRLYVRAGCDDAAAELGCYAATEEGEAARLVLPRVGEGTYYIWIDGAAAGATGGFSIDVAATVPSSADHDNCRSAAQLVFDEAGVFANASGSTLAGLDDYAGSCASATGNHNGPDLVYYFELEAPARVIARVNRKETPFRPVVVLARSCRGPGHLGEELACANEVNGLARANAPLVDAGPVFVIVDGMEGTAGEFDLEVMVGLPGTNDTCENALPIAFDERGEAAFTGDMGDANNDTQGTCFSYGVTKDRVYRLEIPAGPEKHLEVTMEPFGDLQPMISVRRGDCASTAAEVFCRYSYEAKPLTAVAKRLSEGTYYLWLEGGTWVEGTFGVRLRLFDSPPKLPHDTCEGAERFVLDQNGELSLSASTFEALNEYTGSCGAASGGDYVYFFEVHQESRITATLTRDNATSSGYSPAVYLRDGCAETAVELACANHTNGVATAISNLVLPGVYYLFVDGLAGTAGDFTLTVKSGPPLPNDTCARPEVLQFGAEGKATVTATTEPALQSGDGTCGGTFGRDLVYFFETLTDQTLQAEMTFDDPFQQPTLYLRRSCADSASEVACGTSLPGMTNRASLYVPRLPAGAYYLWADSNSGYYASYYGSFTLNVQLSDVPGTPAHDTCAGAERLEIGVGKEGDTTFAAHDTQGSCSAAGGNDVVYWFETTQARQVVATVSRDPSFPDFRPHIYLRTQCDQPAVEQELTCATPDYSGTATLTVNSLAPGAYYLWVDAPSGVYGRFAARVDLFPEVLGPANEGCASAAPIQAVAGATVRQSGTTLLAQSEATGTCVMEGRPDVVYRLELAEAHRRLVVEVIPVTSTYIPSVYVRKSCGSFAYEDQLACASAYSPAMPAIADIKSGLAAGTYWIWVDSNAWVQEGQSGDFTLAVTLDPPPPPNETCAGALALELGNALSGNTADAMDDYPWGSSSAPGCSPPPYPMTGRAAELVYSYTPQSSGSFTVTVTPTYDAAVWVGTGPCGDPAQCIGGSDIVGNEVVKVDNAVAGTTYYIYVDGYNTSTGPFQIKVE